MIKKQINSLLLVLLGLTFWQCAGSGNPGLIGRIYHNTTAQYNAYYLGSERLTDAENKLTAATIHDYNRILPLFPSTDTTITSTLRPQFEEVIKKASFAIKKHPQSRWTPDSYILVGKARYYLGEYDEAIRTFRFASNSTKNEQLRFRSQVWLMRSFIALQDYESADAVSDLLKKARLNKNNALHLFLNRAEYYLIQKDTALAITNLKLAIPLVKNRDYLARARFILAQLYQQTGQDKLAYQTYSKIIKRNPPYELGFYSKLNMGQVTELSNTNDKIRIEKYFTKLLKDPKNVDFRDKVYYEMARFALKQQQYDTALDYLNQSSKASAGNETQKASTYLLAGKIYFENLQKYRLASVYYDSAVQVMPPTNPDYEASSERRDVLTEFSTHFTTIQTQDSLQALARLDTATLNKRITAIMEASAKEQARKQQQLSNSNSGENNSSIQNSLPGNQNRRRNPNGNQDEGTGTWYFDNPTLVARARAEFVQRWGNRALQDNWRLSDREASSVAQTPVAGPADPATGVTPADSVAASPKVLRQNLLQNIPFKPDQLQTSNNQVEESMFNLATIYKQQLNEPTRAAETYEKLLQRFPGTKHKAEAYYSLYLIYQQAKNEKAKTYSDLVKKEFAGSKYAKLIDQPDYLKNVSLNNQKARQLYDSAFANYHRKQYPVAITLVGQLQKQYPDNEWADRIAFLDVLLTGRTQKPAVFKKSVQQFITKYPTSTLLPNAEEILTSFEALESGKLSEKEFNKTHQKTAKEPVVPEPDDEITASNNSAAPTAQVPPRPSRKRPVREPRPKVTNEQPPADDPIANEPGQTETTAESEPGQPTTIPEAETANPTTNATSTTAPAATTPVEAPPTYLVNLATPHVVIIAYPKNNLAFKDIYSKMTAYNTKFNQILNLTIDSTNAMGVNQMLVIKEFDSGKKAASYATKQKAPQSPLSKIRGIEFVTFAISSENLPVLLKEGKLEEYLSFYKNNYF